MKRYKENIILIGQISGVYMLRSKTDREIFYIGSSINLYSRKMKHLNSKSNHPIINGHIKKYGVRDLEFIVLKICNIDQLYYYEQYFISELNPPLNTFKFATVHDISAKKVFMHDLVKEGKSQLYQDSDVLRSLDELI